MALFSDNSAGTFSDVWYRVAEQRPRVSVHARFVRQRHGPSVSYVIDDPAGGHYYRLTESARFFLGLLDGRRTVDQAWEACLAQLRDDAPTQRECLELLAQMQLFGLLVGDQPIAPDMVPERIARFRKQRLRQRTGNWMFYNVPLVNPEPVLRALSVYLRVIWGRLGFAVWLGVVLAAIAVVIAHRERLGSSLNGILDTGNLVWLGVLFMVIRAVHELGHAMACKAMGGRCTEIGVMLIGLLLPLPYCDASSSWKFPETWRRVVVGMGGMLVEIFFAALAAFVWAFGEAGLVRTLAFNTMVISGVSTIIFNANPLLRYDGYYILCDLAGSPNLAQRARQVWLYLLQKRAFGVRTIRPPYVRDRGELRLLLVYHALAVPYRLTVTVSILVLIWTKYLSLGLVLALFFGMIWLVLPPVKGVWYLLTSPALMGRRMRALSLTLGVVVPSLAIVLFVPLPHSTTLPAVVERPGLEMLRVESAGYVQEVLVSPGATVEPGEAIMVLTNPSLESEARAAAARAAYSRATLDDAISRGAAAQRIAEAQLERASLESAEYARRVESLTIRAGTGGEFATAAGAGMDVVNLRDRFLDKGSIVGVVIPKGHAVVRAAIPDSKAGAVLPVVSRDGARAGVRLRGAGASPIGGAVDRVWPAGSRQLEAMQFSAVTGGDFLTDPNSGDMTLESFTLFDVRPESDDGLLPGRRARVRVRLEPSTLYARFSTRVRQFIEAQRQ